MSPGARTRKKNRGSAPPRRDEKEVYRHRKTHRQVLQAERERLLDIFSEGYRASLVRCTDLEGLSDAVLEALQRLRGAA
jgi:hypothetical protein